MGIHCTYTPVQKSLTYICKNVTLQISYAIGLHGHCRKVEIPEMSKATVHMKDPEHLEQILESIKHSGPNTLQVISDFDMTLTRFAYNGKRCPTSHRHKENACCDSVEIYHNCQWGTVCDDHWDIKCWCADSWDVAELSGPLPVPALVREVAQYFWLMLVVLEVKAPSNSALILDLEHNCNHGEDAGVTCSVMEKPL
ncbi:hypothetical protein P4O66_019203 [Electrophorus voltai]|uniref:SRCR domain-containing protein n=1 Tax=Electrophorus voltai TaxID=2609070 RepID=A0AAD8ZV84_9TELE|nr:hypothetical protein P4O66_019203 [Electrophorus voltai]